MRRGVRNQRRNVMNTTHDRFKKVVDETGEEFFCPVSAVTSTSVDSEYAFDNCVEASTVGRYSGNLELAD
jgi:hypothetical protein